MNVIYHLPTVIYQALSEVQEQRPAAIISSAEHWARLGDQLKVPTVVQAEPQRSDYEFLRYLAENLPSAVEVIYAVGNSKQVMAGKVVAQANNLPLVIVATELDSDQLFEPHVETMTDGIVNNIFMGAAEKIIVDWDIIQAAEAHLRAGMVVDMLAIVTGLLDWRYAVKVNRNAADHPFLPWAAGVAAGIASQTIKAAPAIGRGEVEALKSLMDLTALSVQLANQLGHDRHQEGTEHYLAYALENQGVEGLSHAEALAPGILLTSTLHGQDPSALRGALEAVGIRLNAVRQADLELALQNLPTFAATNALPHAIAHDLDPFADDVRQAMQRAGLVGDTGSWQLSPAAAADGAAASDGAAAPALNADGSSPDNPALPGISSEAGTDAPEDSAATPSQPEAGS